MREIITIMHLPAQSGKTRKMTELMNRWDSIISVEGNTTHINIVFTSNSKLLTKQTMKRVVDATTVSTSDSDVSELSDGETEADNFNGIVNDTTQTNRTIAWISGGGAKMDERIIDLMIRAGDVDNVICCTNKQRMTRVMCLIGLLAANRGRLGGRTINIWIDEADACMRLWTKYLRTIIGFDTLINKIVLISATMSPVIKYFHKNGMDCNLRVYDTTHADCYVRFSDCDVSDEYSVANQSPMEQICAVLDNVTMAAGSRWFCPGAVARKSHDEIAAELLRRGFNVLILNGDKKQLVFSDATCPPVNVMSAVSDDVELSEAIRTLYYDYQLDSAPFAVTGNMCISRGITFASKNEHFEFLFTHGIIPDIGSAEEIYQMVARCLGNFRDFDSYISPKLYMTERVASKIANQEHLAIELARRYYTGEENDTHTLSTDEFAAVANEHPVIAPPRTRKAKPQERVPVILSFGPEQEYLYYLKESMVIQKDKVFKSLISMISDNPEYARLLALIQSENTIRFATAPTMDNSYQIRITQVVTASEKGITNATSVYKKDTDTGKNVCNVFVDKRQHRLCIVIWSSDKELY
jgi:hypothetical protein